MKNTKLIGDITETKILTKLVEKGWTVSVPWGEGARYDLVADDGKDFHRIQCKTGRLRNGVIIFNAYSSHYHRDRGMDDYRGQADFFGVYCPELDEAYLVPVSEVGTTKVYLRVEAPKGQGNQHGFRYAKEYQLGKDKHDPQTVG